ncbi:AAA family ATPase [Micromonospora sp. MED01]|uniref:AAA family ATPase n=1 Tax=Micromonospora alfalfae TaxID=2911212 RepID=UPI001EE96B4C|nr:AAA family ATPase [Micromonospora alfalfae]MCG5463753.1 AAA family ATPase [Micromonospora alfalfae]
MPEPRRYVLTGAPGAGKTTMIEALRRRGHVTVREAATDLIAERQAQGYATPWHDTDFVDAVAALQHHRQVGADARQPVQFYDRSPLCTVALARHLGRPVGPALTAEVDRIMRERTYQRLVFLISPLGFIRHTAARQISYADALAFARLHREVYDEHGHQLVEVPAGPVRTRLALIEEHVSFAT